MTTKLFAVVLLALALAACDSSSTPENTNNANRNIDHPTTASPSTGANDQATPAPPASTAVTPQLKAGDKVKVKTNGSSSDATVVSVDEKLGKVTVKLSSGEEKTVALSDVVKP